MTVRKRDSSPLPLPCETLDTFNHALAMRQVLTQPKTRLNMEGDTNGVLRGDHPQSWECYKTSRQD